VTLRRGVDGNSFAALACSVVKCRLNHFYEIFLLPPAALAVAYTRLTIKLSPSRRITKEQKSEGE
jgi:hypothetical protein